MGRRVHPKRWQNLSTSKISYEEILKPRNQESSSGTLSGCSKDKIKEVTDEPTWRCINNPFIGALGIQEPVIPGENSWPVMRLFVMVRKVNELK